jgi:hypothetical protein
VVGNINSTKSIEIDRMQKTLRLITPQNVWAKICSKLRPQIILDHRTNKNGTHKG